jgi:hypothetical protein
MGAARPSARYSSCRRADEGGGTARYGRDPVLANVRPPVNLPAAQAEALASALDAIGFTMPGM